MSEFVPCIGLKEPYHESCHAHNKIETGDIGLFQPKIPQKRSVMYHVTLTANYMSYQRITCFERRCTSHSYLSALHLLQKSPIFLVTHLYVTILLHVVYECRALCREI